ncbi:hypothetical protein [Archaeoglobus sp.]
MLPSKSVRIPEISPEILNILLRFGLEKYITFDLENYFEDKPIRELEKEFEEDYRKLFKNKDVIVNVFKLGQKQYRVEVFVLREHLDEARKVGLKSYIELNCLERFAYTHPDPDVLYKVQKFIKEHKKYIMFIFKYLGYIESTLDAL